MKTLWLVLGLAWVTILHPSAQAGLFSTPHTVEPGRWSLGLEPEFIISSGAGVGLNGRFTHGLSDWNNASLLVGTGTGPRRFRVGGNFAMEIFPMTESQPGIGLIWQGIYYRQKSPQGSGTHGLLELTVNPYVRMSFGEDEVMNWEPFVGVPFGLELASGRYEVVTSIAVGASFPASESLRYVAELTVSINKSESALSGGVVYYY